MDESRDVIQLVNKLQSYFKSTGVGDRKIELPQIVVVGAQSSGKSSVLDGLVGFSILPRGSGTVTKCPIIVQLITIDEDEQEGIEFEENGTWGDRIEDYDRVRDKISELMGKNDGAISETPIIIKVYSPNVVTLTVVDLPGVKRLTSTGEPSNLERLILNLSRKYIQEKNAIILAVSPANYDICNSDGLLLAREADPQGRRTIGVLTKLDLMDEGTNARELLTGTSKDVKLKLGMIGLVNRSQKDIDNNLSILEQLEKERQFLDKAYPDLAHLNGVPYLRKQLHELLVQHILKCLPEILRKLQNLEEQCLKRLTDIPDVMSQKDKYVFLNRIVHGFEMFMRTEIEGSSRSPEYEYLYGGILIKDTFEKKFAADMESAGRLSDMSVSNNMILNAFRNSGSYDSIFVYPEAVFKKLAQNQIKHIERPALTCAERVHDDILKVADRHLKGSKNQFEYFSELRKTIKGVVINMLSTRLEELKKHIEDYIRVQASLVFSLDQRFLKVISDLRKQLEWNLHHKANSEDENDENERSVKNVMIPQSKSCDAVSFLPSIPTGNEMGQYLNIDGSLSKNCELSSSSSSSDCILAKIRKPETIQLIKKMVKTYFDLVKTQTQDYIPKLIADRLVTQFSSDGSLGDSLREKLLENYEQLIKLPNLQESRELDKKLQIHLKEVIAEMKDMLSSYEDEPEGNELETTLYYGQNFSSRKTVGYQQPKRLDSEDRLSKASYFNGELKKQVYPDSEVNSDDSEGEM